MWLIEENLINNENTIEMFVNSERSGYALIRNFQGEILVCNEKYRNDFSKSSINESIEHCDTAIERANLTYCNHLDKVFSKSKEIFFQKEDFNFKNWCSVRAFVRFKNQDAILIIINEVQG